MAEDLTDAYEIGAYTPGMDAIKASWPLRSEGFRATAISRRDLTYGDDPRNRLDLFLPDAQPRGLMVFVHGGYWRITSKDMWSHLAAGGVARGWAVALPSYTLAPGARISQITQEVARAVTYVAGEVAGPIAITGHSAGGHLSARMRCSGVLPASIAARLHSVIPISPVADLRPLLRTAMNSDLRLDEAEAVAESPALISKTLPTACEVWVGADERPVFLDQARWLGSAWACDVRIAPNRHHFDILDALEDPASPLLDALLGGVR